MEKSSALFKQAKKFMPGGVNSPVRAFGAVGGDPLFIERAQGCYVYDADKNRYVDYVGSWGPMVLGHAHPKVLDAVKNTFVQGLSFGAPCELEVELAQLVCTMTGIDMVRMVNSGTEAVMSAIRLARGYTGKNKIIKFEGCYHGHSDGMLVKAGSGSMTMGIPNSSGVSQCAVADTLSASYNDMQSVEQLFIQNKGEIAAVIVEPVAANMGVILPQAGFLDFLRDIATKYESLLIFDEVITGFRLAKGGAQEYFDVQADLVTYGKIIGGGMPVGAYGGKRAIMELVAPQGTVYQAGTLSGNPVAMAAGIAQLSILNEDPQMYNLLYALGNQFAEGFVSIAEQNNYPITVNHLGSLSCVYFTDQAVSDYASAKKADTNLYARYFHAMLENGYYLAPSQFEAMFVGTEHTESIIQSTLETAEFILKSII